MYVHQGLHTVETVVVDLKGIRVVAQAIVPGEWAGRRRVISGCTCDCLHVLQWCGCVSHTPPTPPGLLQADPTSFIRYGAMDNKEEFKTDKDFIKLVRS